MNRMHVLLLCSALALTACGFHLRGSAALPAGMQRVHLTVNGGGDLQRKLARALLASNVTVEDESGTGIAELHVTTAAFSTQMLTVSGYAQVTEYAVHYHVAFNAIDSGGKSLIPNEGFDMQREYSYIAGQPVGSQAQVEAIEGSLIDDAVQAILFRLQAVAKNGEKAAAKAAGATPAPAGSSAPPAVPSTDEPAPATSVN